MMLNIRKKTIRAEDFITGMMDFIPDIRLVPVNIQIRDKQRSGLAASGNYNGNHSIRKIGLLADPDKTVTAKIMEDQKNAEYQIYFLHEDRQSLQYSILSNQKSGRFFIINEDDYTVIPKSTDIDPMTDELVISHAKEVFNFDARTTFSGILLGENGNRLITAFDYDQRAVIFNLIQTENADRNTYKKLLICSSASKKKLIRLVPIVHNRAVVPLPKDAKTHFIICLYY